LDEQYYPLVHQVEDRHWWFRGRRAVVAALLARARVEPPLRVLDAGCGTGRNLQDYRRLGPARGIEPEASAVEFCHQRGLTEVVQAGVEALPFEAGSFDIAFATDVLEHVEDDAAALRELHRVSAPGGLLLATVPAYMWLWSQSDVALHHQRRYSRRELTSRARDNGWEPIVSTYFNSLLLGPIALARTLRRARAEGATRPELELTPAWLDPLLALPMRAEAALIRRGLALPAGISVGMVCRRT
jgi:SAM-dependent methyltransferase